jgi:hypothetical protein
VDTTPGAASRSYDSHSSDSPSSEAGRLSNASNGSSNGSTSWARQPSESAADTSSTDSSPLAGVTAEMRNMARSAANKAQSAAASATQATRKVTAPPKPAPARAKPKGPRRVRLAVARVDPWSIMKLSFLLSVAVGIAGVVLTGVLWMILSTMNVFTDVEGVLQGLQSTTDNPFSIKDYVGFGRVVSLSIVIGVIDVILMTAIATVMAFLYNIASALVGGVQLTLTDD